MFGIMENVLLNISVASIKPQTGLFTQTAEKHSGGAGYLYLELRGKIELVT